MDKSSYIDNWGLFIIDSRKGLLRIASIWIIKYGGFEMEIELGEVQAAFADVIWANEPVSSGELVTICEKQFGWKKSTTYTVLKKLCEKGLFKNEGGIVTSVVSKEQFLATKSERFIEDTFDGSLPAFVTAFLSHKKVSKKEIAEIRKMIDDYKGN